MRISTPPSGNWIDRIVVQRSGTGGISWDNGVGIGLDGSKAQDKEWLAVERSFDGGQAFGRDIIVTDQPGGWGFDIPGIYRCNGLPVTMCDISQSPYRGRIYVLWSDQRHGLVDTDVFIVHSDDHGETWSEPHRVKNDDSQRHQFFPWMAIDQSNGNLYVVFYDRRETNNDETDVFMAVSTNGGASFTNHKISESSFSLKPTIFFGDYNGIDVHEGTIIPVWTRLDQTALSVWNAVIPDSIFVGIEPSAQSVEDFAILRNFPTTPLMLPPK
jgi:hypothetical protein